MNQIKKIAQKVFTKEVISYIIFGILTTLVNIIVSYILKAFCNIETNIASTIGIIASILFAYFTNKDWVFHSKAKGFKEKFSEFLKFVAGRAVTMVLEQGGVIIFYSCMHLPFMPVKLTLTIVVIILNFFFSKFFAFKDKKKEKEEQKN